MSFEAHDYPAYQLFTRRCYGTPRNQRQYVWNRRNWQELFDDVILVATQKEPTHFIGSIVLYREKDRKTEFLTLQLWMVNSELFHLPYFLLVLPFGCVAMKLIMSFMGQDNIFLREMIQTTNLS